MVLLAFCSFPFLTDHVPRKALQRLLSSSFLNSCFWLTSASDTKQQLRKASTWTRDATAKHPVSAACDHYQGASNIVDCEHLSNSLGMRRPNAPDSKTNAHRTWKLNLHLLCGTTVTGTSYAKKTLKSTTHIASNTSDAMDRLSQVCNRGQ